MPDPPQDPSRINAKRAISRFIREHVQKIPLKLIDTCLGVIVDRRTMISNFEKLDEYKAIEESFSGDGASERLQSLFESYFEYAMFSHRWNETETTQEPTYDFIKGAQDSGQNIYSLTEGGDREENMQKLRSFCYTAAKCGFRWAWSDTCCIDKGSPSEIQISINSMFKWYSNSALTIVYFHDVPDVDSSMRLRPHTSSSVHDFIAKHCTESQNPPILQYAKEKHAEEFVDTQVDESALEDLLKRKFRKHKLGGGPEWCVRCWTLQEMVASKHLRFYCNAWKALEPSFDPPDDSHIERFSDHRKEHLWQDALFRSTGVDAKSLLSFTPGATSVRVKLYWASRREATYVEDMAYSLLGIFDIHMPILYGEGMGAFVRLQEEIMKRSHDLGIFDFSGYTSSVNSCLAHSPLCYQDKPLEWKKTKMDINVVSEEEGDEEDSDESGNEDNGGNDEHSGTPSPDAEHSRLSQLLKSTWKATSAASALWVAPFALFDRFKKILQSDPPLGHSLINGTITVSVFEHKVKLKEIEGFPRCYEATTKGLTRAKFTTLEPLVLDKGQYHLVRVCGRDVRRAIEMFVSGVRLLIKDNKADGEKSPSDDGKGLQDDGNGMQDDGNGMQDDEKGSQDGKKGSQEVVQKALDRRREEERERVVKFLRLEDPFVVFLVVHDGETWCRIATESRITVRYLKHKFNQAVERRTLI